MTKALDVITIFERKVQPQYSILNLLIEAKEKGLQSVKAKMQGLQAKHLRYALIIDNDKSNLSDFTIRRIERDFEDLNINLSDLQRQGRIEIGCIPPGNSISGILKRLEDMKIIKKDKRHKVSTWKISPSHVNAGVRFINKSTLDAYELDNIKEYTLGDTQHVMYGISNRIYYGLSREDQSKLKNCINEIDDKVGEIWDIVTDRYIEIWKEKLTNLLRSYGNQELKDIILKDNNTTHVFIAIHGIINNVRYKANGLDYIEGVINKHQEFIDKAIQIYKSNSLHRIVKGLTYIYSKRKENPLI